MRVLVVRPGFVRTRMTAGLPAAPLATTPEAVASVVLAALERGEHTVWAPGRLRWLMLAVRLLRVRSFAGSSDDVPPPRNLRRPRRAEPDREPRAEAERRLRRREASEARRRRGLLRLDVGVGVLAALVLLLATPGVAYAALVALLVLAVCVASVAVEHRRSRRRRPPRRPIRR